MGLTAETFQFLEIFENFFYQKLSFSFKTFPFLRLSSMEIGGLIESDLYFLIFL